jgi:protein tyrosine phosphatase (PTP) superfamily phosphohydrolase (DUF442 family)
MLQKAGNPWVRESAGIGAFPDRRLEWGMSLRATDRIQGRRWHRIAGILTLAAALGLVAWGAHRLAPKHFLTVESGVLYRSGTLQPWQLDRVVQRHGIRTVVNLRSAGDNAQGNWHRVQTAQLESQGVELIDLPMPSGSVPRPDQVETWLGILGDPTRHPILVHCEFGIVRTGIMVAVYEIEMRGWTGPEAFAAFRLFRQSWDPVIRDRYQSFLADDRGRQTALSRMPRD